MKKILVSMLAAAFLFTLTIGCGDAPKTTPVKEKDAKPADKKEEKKDKDAPK
jgi:predicted small lipoprotein YifL